MGFSAAQTSLCLPLRREVAARSADGRRDTPQIGNFSVGAATGRGVQRKRRQNKTDDFSREMWYSFVEVKPMRLLYAEDEKSLARAVSTILRKNNYSVDVVYDGQAALDYLETENYDGAILDVMMPKLDGFEVLRRMRARGDSTPVLLLTAKGEIDDRVEGLDSGANDYLTKPFDMKELLARILAMTRVLSVQPDKTISF